MPSPAGGAARRFVALGDSVTVGLGDPVPGRGWPAFLAEAVGIELVNVATTGALVRDVAGAQLRRAAAVQPSIASVLVGVNDTLRGTFDLAAVADGLEEAIAQLTRAGAVVLTASLPDPGLMLRVPDMVCRPLTRRVRAINVVLDHLSRRYGTVHLDMAGQRVLYDRRMWGVDRLHPSERGHRLLAHLFAVRLAEHGVAVPSLPELEPTCPEPTLRAQLRWLATKGVCWIGRRSRDLLPQLAGLVAWEWLYRLRRRTAVLDMRSRSQIDAVLRAMNGSEPTEVRSRAGQAA